MLTYRDSCIETESVYSSGNYSWCQKDFVSKLRLNISSTADQTFLSISFQQFLSFPFQIYISWYCSNTSSPAPLSHSLLLTISPKHPAHRNKNGPPTTFKISDLQHSQLISKVIRFFLSNANLINLPAALLSILKPTNTLLTPVHQVIWQGTKFPPVPPEPALTPFLTGH